MKPTLRIPRPVLRPVVALVLVFAQAVGAFGFPVLQTRYTVKACGCVTPCGAETANCCCAKPVAQPEPQKPRCPKCVQRSESEPATCSEDAASPTIQWVAGFQARKCRGESPMGVLADSPSLTPESGETGHDYTRPLHAVCIDVSLLVSHVSELQDPPPRRS